MARQLQAKLLPFEGGVKVAEQDVINWKELTAVRLALESHVGDLQGLRVINRTDNVATLAALNKSFFAKMHVPGLPMSISRN